MESIRALFVCVVSTVVAGVVACTAIGSNTSSKAGKIDALMSRFYAERGFHGVVLVADDGDILYQKAFGAADVATGVDNTLETKFWIASMSKQFAAATAMLLVEDGKLRLDDHVSDFIPDYPQPSGGLITVHHLLTHTSGIPQDDPLKGAFAENKQRPNTREELRSCFQDRELLFAPGAGFQYSNFNYALLVMMMEAASGKPYSQLLREKILDPLDMTGTGVGEMASIKPPLATGYRYGFLQEPVALSPSHPSVSLGSGDVYSTAADLHKWDRALYTNRLLSESSRRVMFTVHADRFGYGWQVGGYPVGKGTDSVFAVYHDGGDAGNQSVIIRLPEDERLVVILANQSEPWIHTRLSRPRQDIAPAILAILYDRPYDMPAKSAAYTLAVADTMADDFNIDAEYARLRKESADKYSFDAEEFYNVGLSYAWDKNPQKAATFLKIVVEDLGVDHLPDAWQCYNVYGESLFLCGIIEPGCAQFERSLQLKPDNPFAVAALKAAEPYRDTTGQ